ncbi:MAG: hypothetical protein ACLUEU_10015 [Oscillospiraceae bacterium]
MNWPWKKKKLSFAETAKFNWEADTNEELRRKLNELAKQYPTLREGEYREKLLSLFRERGWTSTPISWICCCFCGRKRIKCCSSGRRSGRRTSHSLRPAGHGGRRQRKIFSADGHDDHTEAGGAPRRHYTSGI